MTEIKHVRRLCALLLSFSILLVSLGGTGAQQRRRSSETAQQSAQSSSQSDVTSARPRLVLLIAVDQFRYDFLERFGDLFAPGGLRRLMREGALWTNANYDHMPTYTAPGHATMMTGAWPAETGIIANDWFDRDTGKNVTSVSDEQTVLLGGEEGEKGSSPRRLMASTVGDELRLATDGRSKVIGISVKDRSAILPSGRHASAAYWFSTRNGRMVTSNYYFNQPPAWVVKFNDARPADKFFGARWERLLPEAEYRKRAGEDAPRWEDIGKAAGDTNAFPHTVTGGATAPNNAFYGALDYTPFSNELLLSFAEQAIVNEQLGGDDDTDLLSVSFSANDYVGHRFGPYSHEVMDITLRVDRTIESLLNFVNTRVGLQNTLVIFTADHGVAPIPEHASAMGLSGGRIAAAEVLRAMQLAIKARYNPKNTTPDPTADYVQNFYNGNLYFNMVALRRDGVDLDEIERIAGDAAMTVPGINRYFTRTQLQRGAISLADPIARRVLHGFYSRRSGDLIVVYDPFKYLTDYSIPATHGSPYSYDTHVPIILMGRGVRPGLYIEASTPADIAPTVASILRVQAPSNTVGRVLIEGIMQRTTSAGAAR